MAWDEETIRRRNVIAYWELKAENRPVKITGILRHPGLWAEGYITCYKFVAGRSLEDVERILGLKVGELAGGAYLYEFMRSPSASEFELRGYTQCPAGENWTAASDYPPGLGAPQWEVTREAYIPSRLAAIVDVGGTFVIKNAV